MYLSQNSLNSVSSLVRFPLCVVVCFLCVLLMNISILCIMSRPKKVKGKVFPYSLPSVGPGADPGVQAVSPQVT